MESIFLIRRAFCTLRILFVFIFIRADRVETRDFAASKSIDCEYFLHDFLCPHYSVNYTHSKFNLHSTPEGYDYTTATFVGFR